ncbi:unnamed protein product [Schistocephalus solidus]|uniref:Cellulase n=1 Tax=Schistocephalus solidus TaxID=70667 RepID=A0A183T2C5_SCHSO|nr:unnamed protein product [Schistocephalus solidus]
MCHLSGVERQRQHSFCVTSRTPSGISVSDAGWGKQQPMSAVRVLAPAMRVFHARLPGAGIWQLKAHRPPDRSQNRFLASRLVCFRLLYRHLQRSPDADRPDDSVSYNLQAAFNAVGTSDSNAAASRLIRWAWDPPDADRPDGSVSYNLQAAFNAVGTSDSNAAASRLIRWAWDPVSGL